MRSLRRPVRVFRLACAAAAAAAACLVSPAAAGPVEADMKQSPAAAQPLARKPEPSLQQPLFVRPDTKSTLQWRGTTSGIRKATAVTVNTFAEWVRLWNRHAPGTRVPPVNFRQFMAVAVFQGSESPDRCCMQIADMGYEHGAIQVYYGFGKSQGDESGPFSSFNIKIIPWSDAFVDFIRKDNP